MTACAHAAANRTAAPAQETPPPSALAQPPASVASVAPLPLPQSDPIPPPAPRCPSFGALVKASAVVKREPPSRAQASTSPAILDIELTVALPTNPIQATFGQNQLTVYGGVLLQPRFQTVNPTHAVVLIRPAWSVGPRGSLRALFGTECTAGAGNLRVDMTFASPTHEGDKVSIGGVGDY